MNCHIANSGRPYGKLIYCQYLDFNQILDAIKWTAARLTNYIHYYVYRMCLCVESFKMVKWGNIYNRCSFGMRVNTSAGKTLSKLLLSASQSKLSSPANASEWISRKLLEIKNSFSIWTRPAKLCACSVSMWLPPMCSSFTLPKLREL